MRIVGLALAALLFLAGVRSAVRSLAEPVPTDDGGSRLLIAVHDASRALFWFSLAGFFVAFEVASEPWNVRWLILVPIAMAVVRLLTASALARR